MQEVIQDVVKSASKGYVLVDTRCTPDHGWETMVFKCNQKGTVKNWTDLDCRNYGTQQEANNGHAEIVNKWIIRIAFYIFNQ